MIVSCPRPSAVVAERDADEVEAKIVVHRVARLREIECRSKVDAREN